MRYEKNRPSGRFFFVDARFAHGAGTVVGRATSDDVYTSRRDRHRVESSDQFPASD